MIDMTVRELVVRMQRRILSASTYAGVRTVKCPLDWWVYQEILWERRPDVVVEIGNYMGGTLLALAHQLDAIGQGRVIGVDLQHAWVAPAVRAHPRIRLVTGDATQVMGQVAAMIEPGAETLVIEDSSHEFQNTLAVLRAYEGLVQPGGYFIVEDTICWHGLDEGPFPGPMEAVSAFLKEHPEWEMDRSREAFGLTWNPGGYLRRRGLRLEIRD